MQQVTLAEASERLSQLVEAVLRGEEVSIAINDRPIVRLTPIQPEKPRPKFGSGKGLIWMSDDFDEPLEEFKEYMESGTMIGKLVLSGING